MRPGIVALLRPATQDSASKHVDGVNSVRRGGWKGEPCFQRLGRPGWVSAVAGRQSRGAQEGDNVRMDQVSLKDNTWLAMQSYHTPILLVALLCTAAEH